MEVFENPLFFSKRCGYEWIDYDGSSINKMLNNVDDDEKDMFNIGRYFRGYSSKYTILVLTEDGLYEVLKCKSRKPIAKKFKKRS